ncbi:MAG: FecCD family ABC transporter permease [Hyphomonadaceae bacterium]
MNRAAPFLALTAVVALLFALSLTVGKVWVPLSAWGAHADPRWAIVFELRLPRAILAVLIGAALGLSGAAMQGYTRNPLADPGVLGVSGMAALGAVIALYFGLTAQGYWILGAGGVAGALAGVAALLALAGREASVTAFVLAGVILQSVAGALVALALNLAPNPWATQEILDWLMGGLTDRSFAEVQLAAPLIFAGGALLFSLRRALDALSLGEASAASLGVDLRRTQMLLALGAALATGASVAVSGVVGFVGLVAPHAARLLFGAQPGGLLAPSALAGAMLVLGADIAVRLTPGAEEVKLGVAMALLGGPVFLALLLSLRRRIV